MSLTVDQYIEAYCPKLAVDPAKALFVAEASDMYSVAVLGAYKYTKAVAYRAMHDFTVSRVRKGNAGGVIGIREGNAAMQFNDQSRSDNPLDSTSYGQTLKELLRINALATGLNLGG